MELEQIDEVLEALLFVSGDGLELREIAEHLELQKSELNGAVNRLKAKYSGKCGIHLITYNNKVQLCSNPEYADTIAKVLNPIKEKELSNATLETVAIIAYRQPITRLEVEQVRGVSCEYAIQVLLKHGLIEAVGRRDAVGKPLLFGTTDAFLKRFQIEDISQLPDYDKLLESIKVLEDKTLNPEAEANDADGQSMYNEFEIPDEEEVPDFLEGEEGLKRVEG